MLRSFLGRFSHDMGIDLGSSVTAVYVRDRGIIIHEPSIVAVNTRTNRLLAVGDEAKRMLGKAPPHILITKPLHAGVISDFEATEKMLRNFINRVHNHRYFMVPRPRVVITIPIDVTEVERKAVEDAVLQAGAREVTLVENPVAAAIGARLPIQDPGGTMIVVLGGGTTEVAVISLSGIVTWRSLKVGGEEMDRNIINYVREKGNLLIGERTAEDIKIHVGAVLPLKELLEMSVRGRDIVTGLPREMRITSRDVTDALAKTVKLLTQSIQAALEATPPELVADIHERGISLAGGIAQLRGVSELIHEETKIPVRIIDDPSTVVVRGTGILLEDAALLREVALPTRTT